MLTAQEVSDSTDLFYKHLELKEIVITGITGDTRLKESPSPVAVILPAELQSKASTNIINAIAKQPGISEVTTGGGISKPVIRGLGFNRVLVVNDGIRQEGQQWGAEHGVEIDGATIHSVEILKGPASLMYGSDALAGVIIFHSMPSMPDGELAGSFSSEYQTNNGLYALSFDQSGNKGGIVWDVRYSEKHAHAYKNSHDGYVSNSGFGERAVSGTAGIRRNWGYSNLRLSMYHLHPGIIEGEEGPAGYRPGLPFQHIRHYKAVMDNTFLLSNGQIKTILGWQQNRRQEFEESEDEYGLFFLLNTLNYDVRYQNEWEKGWKMATGVNGMFQSSENRGDEYLIPAYNLFDAGIFATASKTMDKWILSGGLRADIRALHSFEQYEEGSLRFEDFSRNFKGLTGSIGAVRPIGRHADIHLNLARGFRAPNLSELGSNGKHEGALRYEIGNKDLMPEFSLQGDASLVLSFKKLSGSLALFANRIDNYIFLTKTTSAAVPVYSYTSGNAFLKGGEASIDYHPIHSLHLASSFSYVDGKLLGEDWLPLIPAPRLNLECKYEFTHDGRVLNNSFASVYYNQFFAQNHFYAIDDTETATPSYGLLGFSAGTDILIRGIKRATLLLVADNITDKAYQSHLSRLKEAGIYNMGRNITLKLNIMF